MMTTDDVWLCYSVQWLFNDRWETPYIGVSPATTFRTLPDANRNSLFVENITDRETWRVSINGALPSEEAAEAMRSLLIESMTVKPYFNAHGHTVEARKRGRSQRLRNTTTGVEYANGVEAARMLGVTVSMVSKHLTGHSATVAGTTLERIA